MSNRILATWCAGGLLAAATAGAETYRIVDGRLDDATTGGSDVLEGVLEVSLFEPECPAIPVLRVDDLELQAGARSFGPQQPVLFEGRFSLAWLPDQIHFDGDTVESARLRSGGGIVAIGAREVTVRFLEFRAQAPDAGRLVGHLGNTLLPRRISLLGTLYEVDQRFPLPTLPGPLLPTFGRVTFRWADVSNFPLLPRTVLPTPGGVIAIGGGGGGLELTGVRDFLTVAGGSTLLTRSFESFDVQAGHSAVAFQSPAVGGAALARVTGSAFATAPTLAELGITAPSGAEVTFDDAGALTVRSEGDLLVAGGVIDVPGLTSLTLVTLGNITAEGMHITAEGIELPSGATLNLNAGSAVWIEGDLRGSPGDAVLEVPSALFHSVVTFPIRPIFPICLLPMPFFPPAEEREVGTFSLVASAAEQVEIDFEPRRHGGSRHPDRDGIVSVAILGSADLDIRDVDERSLRLGPGEAEPRSHHGRDRTDRVDVNRDGEMDVVVRFDAREAEIAVGDTEVCLFGETTDGTPIEGCDALETRPEHPQRTRRGHDEDDDEGDQDDDGDDERDDRGRQGSDR